MNKSLLVAQREYLENVRTKGFWIGIFSVPILYALMFFVPTLLEKTRSAQKYAIVDQSGWLADAVETRVMESDLAIALAEAQQRGREADPEKPLPKALADLGATLADLEAVHVPLMAQALARPEELNPNLPSAAAQAAIANRDALVDWWRGLTPEEAKNLSPSLSKASYLRVDGPNASAEALNQNIVDDELFAYFIIGPDPLAGSEGFQYLSKNLTDRDLQRWFSRMAGDVVSSRRMAQENIDPQVAAWLQTPVSFEGLKVSASGEAEAVSRNDRLRQWAPTILVYILWLSVFINVQMLLSNTIEEKSNRLIEVLLSSISPVQLMSGKILGIAATGLTILAAWVASFYLGATLLPRYIDMPADLDLTVVASDPLLLGSFLVYFALGYLFYAAILAGLGSVCNSLKEAQNVMTPVMFVLFVPLLLMVPVGKDPNGVIAQVFSFIPPFTPFVMLNRAAGPPDLWEYVATTALMLVSIAAALWAAAKVFRIGILLTGKPPKLREILRWIKAPIGQVPQTEDAESR